MAPKKRATAPAQPLPAQGKGVQKRTPQSAFDAAAGKDIYERCVKSCFRLVPRATHNIQIEQDRGDQCTIISM